MVVMRVLRRLRARAFAARLLVGASSLLAGLGCDSSDEEKLDPTERYCDALCARAEQCGIADGSCAGICNENADVGPLREDVAEEFASCFSAEPCFSLADQETFLGCWDQMLGSFAATEYGRKFCVAHVSSLFSCGYSYSTEACEADYSRFSDEALADLLACTEQPCEEIMPCVDLSLWGTR